ncbi:MAG: hypothetical protein IIA03_16480, partial [Proteobacteria bacterium]|nr:hypothetical protein [Pseudomonadota bacterium]
MFKRILVPTDGSDITAHAADTAIQSQAPVPGTDWQLRTLTPVGTAVALPRL